MDNYVYIYTDGACSGNPGPGGWGAVLRYNGHERQISGWSNNTTNNRMELLAAIRALETLKRPCRVILTTDSQYVKKGMAEWLDAWKKRGWKTVGKKAVKNQDLWKKLDLLCQEHSVRWKWIKGHNGHPENELADELAVDAIRRGSEGDLVEDKAGRLT